MQRDAEAKQLSSPITRHLVALAQLAVLTRTGEVHGSWAYRGPLCIPAVIRQVLLEHPEAAGEVKAYWCEDCGLAIPTVPLDLPVQSVSRGPAFYSCPLCGTVPRNVWPYDRRASAAVPSAACHKPPALPTPLPDLAFWASSKPAQSEKTAPRVGPERLREPGRPSKLARHSAVYGFRGRLRGMPLWIGDRAGRTLRHFSSACGQTLHTTAIGHELWAQHQLRPCRSRRRLRPSWLTSGSS